jgi:hypothetical protein
MGTYFERILMMIRKVVAYCSLALFFSAAVAVAHADTIGTVASFTLTNKGSLPAAGPFGTITLTQTAAGVVTVKEVLAANEYYASTGAGDSLEFNIKPSDGTLSFGSISSGFEVGPAPDTASPFGTFLESITCISPTACQGGNTTNTAGPLSFTVTSASGVNVSDFIGNSGGFFFASDIFIGNTVTGVGQTGNVASGGPNGITPEPSSLMLLGTGILGAAALYRRRLISAVNRG